MSLTVMAFAVAAFSLFSGVTFALASEKTIIESVGLLLIAVGVGSFIIGTGSYNQNVAEEIRQSEISCVQDGGKVTKFNGLRLCITEESEIIRGI